jgi:predicted DNA-binding transcriptional regulator AlpA
MHEPKPKSLMASASTLGPAPQSTELVDSKGAVEHLGGRVSEATLQRWRSEGGGPRFCKIGPRRIGYRIADLDKWVNDRVAESTADARVRGLAA